MSIAPSIAAGIVPDIASSHPVAEPPRVAIIVPAYGHPVLLSEALESALAQRDAPPFVIVIVSDGCKQPETDLICRTHALAHPAILYLRKDNGGPSSARNYGIDFVLRSWPEIDAVFFLDADNRLSPTALGDAYRAWRDDPSVGWIFPTITSFGLNWTANYAIPYSPLLHTVYDNMCDTGSLVSRKVLEAGVRFDEDARSGYEDWDFWLQCLGHGFVGRHAPFGFAYRQRPESRFREMNRRRGAMIEHLRARHWDIAQPRNLLRWEHETNPRYQYAGTGSDDSLAFVDPRHRATRLPRDTMIRTWFAALQQPDEALMAPFFVWGDDTALAELDRLGLTPGLFLLLEREAGRCNFAVLTMTPDAGEVGLRIGTPDQPDTIRHRAVLWMCTARLVREMVADPEDGWLESLNSDTPGPTLTEIALRAPLLDPAAACATQSGALRPLLATFRALRASPYRDSPTTAWNWRPRHFPAREDYYAQMCRYLDIQRLLPRLSTKRPEVAVLLPIASFGGAEKVAYAMARYLQGQGCGLHLFVVGPAQMKIIPEYSHVFETVTFLANADFPVWGGPATNFGQEVFLPDAPEIRESGLLGLLATFDLVVNCHSAPANSVMGALRAQRIRTATYLHVFDSTPRRRSVGHPYLTLGFEHAYDLVLTCSEQLAGDLHGLGVPGGKIMPIRNAASFSIDAALADRMRQHRATPRNGRALRCLYLGRLDRQKGVERLLGAVRRLVAAGTPIEWRIVGSGLLEGGVDWTAEFGALGITVEPPAYGSDALAAIYGWADLLLLPSRWEGAPLVIPEAHLLGCIPIATDVGAVAELLTHDVDGVLLPGSASDDAIAESMAEAVMTLAGDDTLRQRMALAALHTSATNGWDHNFAPLGAWVRQHLAQPDRIAAE